MVNAACAESAAKALEELSTGTKALFKLVGKESSSSSEGGAAPPPAPSPMAASPSLASSGTSEWELPAGVALPPSGGWLEWQQRFTQLPKRCWKAAPGMTGNDVCVYAEEHQIVTDVDNPEQWFVRLDWGERIAYYVTKWWMMLT